MTSAWTEGMGRPELEVWRLGGTTCLFRPANHATCLVNDTAALILHDITAGDGDAQIAERIASQAGLDYEAALAHVTAVRTHARSGGLIGDLANVAADVDLLPANDLADGPGAPHFALDRSRPVGVVIDDPRLARLIAAVLAPLRGDVHAPDTIAAHRIQACGRDAVYSVALDTRVVARDADLATARRVILQSVLLSIHALSDVAAILHGSVVTIGGRGVLLAGASGSGKSTLMLSLIASGSAYVSDDFTPLSGDGTRLASFPTAVSVKSGSWSLAGASFPAINAAATFRLGPREVRYLDLSAHRESRTRGIPAAAIIFPRYAPSAPAMLASLAPEEAFRLLIDAGAAPAGNNPSMSPIVEFIGRTPAWSLAYGDVAEAVALVKGLLR